jgi:ribosomal protein L9
MDINSITITDILGEIVFEQKNIDKERAEIKTDELKSGIYFVSVYLNNNITLTRKIIKE